MVFEIAYEMLWFIIEMVFDGYKNRRYKIIIIIIIIYGRLWLPIVGSVLHWKI